MSHKQLRELPTIKVTAAIINDTKGRTLLVRKRGTDFFMQAGGKMEAGENPLSALSRQLKEELGMVLNTAKARYVGCHTAPAANEEGYMVEAEMFLLEINEEVFPAAEIEEIAWFNIGRPIDLPLAPLTRDNALPIANTGKALH